MTAYPTTAIQRSSLKPRCSDFWLGVGLTGMADFAVWLTLVLSLSRGVADTVHFKVPTINHIVSITTWTGPRIPRKQRYPRKSGFSEGLKIIPQEPGTSLGPKLSLECAELVPLRPAELINPSLHTVSSVSFYWPNQATRLSPVDVVGRHNFLAKSMDTGGCEGAGPSVQSTTRTLHRTRPGPTQEQPWWPVMVSMLLGHNTCSHFCVVFYTFPQLLIYLESCNSGCKISLP